MKKLHFSVSNGKAVEPYSVLPPYYALVSKGKIKEIYMCFSVSNIAANGQEWVNKQLKVELQNDEYGEERWIDSVFTSYRFTTEYLLDEGYVMYPVKDDYTGEWDLHFEWEQLDEKGKFITDWEIAKIIKMEVKQ